MSPPPSRMSVRPALGAIAIMLCAATEACVSTADDCALLGTCTGGAGGAGGTGAGGTGTGGTGAGGGDVGHPPACPGDTARSWSAAGEQSIRTLLSAPGGEIVMAGNWQGPLKLGNSTLDPPGADPSVSSFFTARLASAPGAAGDLGFSEGPLRLDMKLHSGALDGEGNLVVAGTRASMDALSASGPGSPCPDMPAGPALVLVKVDAGGNCLWAKAFPASQPDDLGVRVAIGPDGRIVLAGGLTGDITFEKELLSTGAGVKDIFVAALGSDGTPEWSDHYGDGVHDDEARAVLVAGNGDILVAGQFEGVVNPSNGDVNWVSDGETAGFVAALDGAGTIKQARWFQVTGGPQHVTALAADGDEVIVAGDLTGSATLGASVELPGVEYKLFLTRFALDGLTPLLGRSYLGGGPAGTVGAIAVGPSGEALLTGWFQGDLHLGAPADPPLSAGAGEKIFTALFGGDGALLGSRVLGDGSENRCVAAAFDGPRLLVAGHYSGKLTIGDGTFLSPAKDDRDMFVARLCPP